MQNAEKSTELFCKLVLIFLCVTLSHITFARSNIEQSYRTFYFREDLVLIEPSYRTKVAYALYGGCFSQAFREAIIV